MMLMMSLYQYQLKFGNVTCADIYKISDAIIVPILYYGSVIWGTVHYKVIQKVQTYFYDMFLKLSVPTMLRRLALLNVGEYLLVNSESNSGVDWSD